MRRRRFARENPFMPKSEYFRSGGRTIDAIENVDDIQPGILTGAEKAAYRAIEAGANPPIEYIGAGATGVVFCDENFAFKVARHGRATYALEDEAEWLETAAGIPEVAPYVAALDHWDPINKVIVRECVRGDRGTWGGSRKIHELWDRLMPHMLSEGWTMPELKEDSVIFVDQQPKIVDAGMVSRISNRLLDFVEGTLDGRIDPRDEDSISDFAFYVRREFGMKPPMNEARAKKILERLYAMWASEG
jgi:hypothetical protein